MLRFFFAAIIITAFHARASTSQFETPGSDSYNCPGSGSSSAGGDFEKKAECSQECQKLEFDCANNRLMVNGQPKEIDGENWLGCASQTGRGNGHQPHKFTEQGCGSGRAGLLPNGEPKLLSDPLPCTNCVVHRMPKGAETQGCLGLEAKLFDFVFKTCGGCSYTIIAEGNGGGGGGNSRPTTTSGVHR